MTPANEPQGYREISQAGFSKFWFVYGGGIHAAWKQKQYSQIKTFAMSLPKAAWDAAFKTGWDSALTQAPSVNEEMLGALKCVVNLMKGRPGDKADELLLESFRAIIDRAEQGGAA